MTGEDDSRTDRPAGATGAAADVTSGGADAVDEAGQRSADAADDDGAAAVEDLVRVVRPAPVRRDVDPEDWASGRGSDDDRYLRERPPHWE